MHRRRVSSAVTWTSTDPSIATIDPTTGVFHPVGDGEVMITASLGGISGSILFIDPAVVNIGNDPETIGGQYLNAQNIADNLVFTTVEIQADSVIVIVDAIDLSTSSYGVPVYGLFLTAPTIIFDHTVNRSASGDLYLNANAVWLGGQSPRAGRSSIRPGCSALRRW